jgi:hypothetical protein
MEYLVEATNPNVSKFLDGLMPSMVEQLGLTRSRRAVLVKVTDEIEEGMQGATLNIEIADCYLVLIKQPKRITKASLLEMGTTLAHEMVHVRQLAKGLMKFLPNQARIWMSSVIISVHIIWINPGNWMHLHAKRSYLERQLNYDYT